MYENDSLWEMVTHKFCETKDLALTWVFDQKK